MKYLKIAVASIGTILLINLIMFIMKIFIINILKIPGLLSEKQLIIAIIIRDLSFVVIIFFTLILLYKINIFKTMKINKFPKKKNIKFIIMMILSGMFFGITLSAIVGVFIPTNEWATNSIINLKNSVLGIMFVVIIAPILEEIMFRGILFNYLRKQCNVKLAIIIQAIAFGIFHGNASQGTNAFIMGIVLATIYLYTDSLWGNIIGHGFANLLGVITSIWAIGSMILLVTSIISIIILIKNRNKYKEILRGNNKNKKELAN